MAPSVLSLSLRLLSSNTPPLVSGCRHTSSPLKSKQYFEGKLYLFIFNIKTFTKCKGTRSASTGTVQKKARLLIHFTVTPGNKLYGESFNIFAKQTSQKSLVCGCPIVQSSFLLKSCDLCFGKMCYIFSCSTLDTICHIHSIKFQKNIILINTAVRIPN